MAMVLTVFTSCSVIRAVTVRLIGLGAFKDHQALLDFGELGVLLLPTVGFPAGLLGMLLGLAL